MENVFTKYLDLPTTIRSFVIANKDDTYTVIINAKMGNQMQLLAYQHELDHINNGDYEKRTSVDLIELNAHEMWF